METKKRKRLEKDDEGGNGSAAVGGEKKSTHTRSHGLLLPKPLSGGVLLGKLVEVRLCYQFKQRSSSFP